MRARLSGRASLRGRVRPPPRGTEADRDRTAAALRDATTRSASGARLRDARTVQLAARRGDRRRARPVSPAQASSRRSATPSRSTTSGSSRAASSATRLRRIACCAEPLAGRGTRPRRARRCVRARRRDRHAGGARRRSPRTPTPSCSLSAWGRRRRPLSRRRASGRLGVAAVHRGDQDRARAGGRRRRVVRRSAAATPRSTSRARPAGSVRPR